jgi:hypothetical protein
VSQFVDDNVLETDLLSLAWSGEKGSSWNTLQVEGNELLRSFVVALRDLLSELDAELELELDAGEELDLQLAKLVLNIFRNGAFELVGSPLGHERTDLVVEVVDLVLDQVHELQSVEDCHLWAELSLQSSDLVLARGELGLKGLSLGRNEVNSLKLVSELGSLRDQSLLLESVLKNELQVERIEGAWSVA